MNMHIIFGHILQHPILTRMCDSYNIFYNNIVVLFSMLFFFSVLATHTYLFTRTFSLF